MTTLNINFEIEDSFLQNFLKLIESLPKSEVKVNIETEFGNIDTSHIPLIDEDEQKEIRESLSKISKEDNEIDHNATRIIKI